jgi:hypothetical protein
MKKLSESISYFCKIQLEIINTREHRLQKELQDCAIQREFLSQVLQETAGTPAKTDDIMDRLLHTYRSSNK